MRKALIVGVDYYEKIGSLHGCVNDALAVAGVLEEHANHGTNFITPNVLTATSKEDAITRRILKEEVRKLFEWDEEIALLYFAGHGYVEDTGGFLCASDSESGDDGLALSEVMTFAHNSRANNRIIILDSCHSGAAAERATQQAVAEIPEGVTILTASTAEQYAMEENGSGLFTGLLIDALNGAAANLVGDVTPGSIYAHIDQSLGPWVQRPFFKTNVKRFVSLRKTLPPIEIADLRKIKTHFPTPYYQIQLDPAYERERPRIS